MLNEKREILDKINKQISKKINTLIDHLPVIHSVEDGLIIRYFTKWDKCSTNENIRLRHINNISNPNETVIFYFIPKGAYFTLQKREHIKYVVCLSGKVEIEYDGNTQIIDNYTKLQVNSGEFQGKAIENTYVLTLGQK